MNKDLLNQLPADEQPIASKLDSVAEDMNLSPGFQSELENQLLDAYKTKTQSAPGGHARIIPTMGWALLILGAVFVVNWTLRSGTPGMPPAAQETVIPEVSFAASVRQGDICADPLALAHGFDVFLTNENKTRFVPVDTGNSLDELRSFAWSPAGERLAVVGNSTGGGIIYITHPTDDEREYTISASEAGYLRDAVWSRDGTQFAIWSSQNLTTLYLLNANGSGVVEKQLNTMIVGTPQFTPDGKRIVFYGADTTVAGLFELDLESSQLTLINPSVDNESMFAFSPDGSLLAYMEYDQGEGEARLFTQKLATDERMLLGTFPIPENPGSSLPEAANLSWTPDGSVLVFDLGYFASQRAIYMARAAGGGLTQIVESGYAPAVSSDGRCLAYISGKQVFLLDLAETLSNSTTAAPMLLADLPAGRVSPDSRLDKLGWRP